MFGSKLYPPTIGVWYTFSERARFLDSVNGQLPRLRRFTEYDRHLLVRLASFQKMNVDLIIYRLRWSDYFGEPYRNEMAHYAEVRNPLAGRRFLPSWFRDYQGKPTKLMDRLTIIYGKEANAKSHKVS